MESMSNLDVNSTLFPDCIHLYQAILNLLYKDMPSEEGYLILLTMQVQLMQTLHHHVIL